MGYLNTGCPLEQEHDIPYRKVGQFQLLVDWLKKNWFRKLTVAEMRAIIEPDHPSLGVKRQCEQIGLCRSSYYGKKSPDSGVLLES